jgi:UDP-N-acetylmuramoyl-tripeptide--D-alanyl-D-alanine ligase
MRAWDIDKVARAAGASVVHRPGDGTERGGGTRDERAVAPPGPMGVSVDSRVLAPGELFVGLAGERVDGGEYAAQALQAGAWGVLVAPEHALAVAAIAQATAAGAAPGPGGLSGAGWFPGAGVIPRAGGSPGTGVIPGAGGFSGDGVVLAHPDPLAGLQWLARAWLSELRVAGGARVVAITGSTGKTSTKDILAAMLSPHLRTVASPENLNTEIGLPLAILAAPAGTEALVLEMAMRGRGQIAELTRIGEPDVGVIVNVGPVHLEQMGSIEGVAEAKGELIEGLKPGASAIVPADEPLLDLYRREDVRTVTFGPGGDVQLAEHQEDGGVVILDGMSAGQSPASPRDRAPAITVPSEPARIVLKPSFKQEHNLRNLLAAVAAARALGVTPGGEVSVRFSALRGERVQLSEGIVLIDDCYNANPLSMRAAIDDLGETAPGRRVAVLGDMLELGPDELRFHREIGAHAAKRGVDVLVTVGSLAGEMAGAFADADAGEGRGERKTHSVPDAPAAGQLLGGLLAPGDTVLVKGSRGVGLERVGQVLLARDRQRTPSTARGPAAPARAQAGAGGRDAATDRAQAGGR